jgi:thiamine-phosphate pyrophosphorylase
MLVTDDRLLAGRDPLELVRAAARGGITSVQLRLKEASPRELLAIARTMVATLQIPVLVNDRPDVAIAARAAGVHLGPDDLPVSMARRIAPPHFVIGASVGNEEEASRAADADYWGIGPWRTTSTKVEAGEGLGAEGFARLVGLAGGVPCLAIGGVRPGDVPLVLAVGGAGVAVASGILGAADPEEAAGMYGPER